MAPLLPLAVLSGLVSLFGLTPSAHAQDETADEPPPLPTPTLDEEPVLTEPLPEPEPEPQGRILYRIGPGMHPEWEEDDRREAPLPPDIAFEIPNDARTTGAPMRLPIEDTTPEARTFGVSLGAGFARLLGTEPVDFFRVEQRFHARVPGMDFLYLGAAASQMFGDNAVLGGGGARIGFGATFCGAREIRCEGVAFVQPGVLAGDLLGARFDLHAALEARFLFPPMLELGVSGGYSFLGGASMFHVTAMGGLAF